MMIGSGNNLNRGSAFVPSNMPSLPQCLPLEPITLGNQKISCSGELKKALGVSSGNALEDRPFGVVHLKRQPPVASKEMKHFKDSVQDSSRRARYIFFHLYNFCITIPLKMIFFYIFFLMNN